MSDEPKTEWADLEGKTITPPQVVKSREALIRLKRMLEGLLEKDQKEVARLREQLHRRKHGGGA